MVRFTPLAMEGRRLGPTFGGRLFLPIINKSHAFAGFCDRAVQLLPRRDGFGAHIEVEHLRQTEKRIISEGLGPGCAPNN